MSTYTAQNLGAGQIKRIKQGVLAANKIMLVYYIVLGTLAAFWGILCVYRNCVQGMGYGVISLAGGMIELIARSIVAAVTMYYPFFAVVCLGYPAAWLLAAIFFVIVYYFIMKKLT